MKKLGKISRYIVVVLIACVTIAVYLFCDKQEFTVHDVTIKAYYVDGSTKIMEIKCVRLIYPKVEGEFHPCLNCGRDRYIMYIDRIDILKERIYKVNGPEYRSYKNRIK